MSSDKKKGYADGKSKFGVSFGQVADLYASQSIIYLTMPIYNVLLNVSPAAIGIILGFFRFWDAFTDPLVGKISDNLRTPAGRRRPLILIGGIATGILFPLIWLASPSWEQTPTLFYLCLTLALYYFAYSFYSVPYKSLSLELSPSYDGRTDLFAFSHILATILTVGIPWLVAIGYSNLFSTPIQGMRIVGLGVGFIIVAGSILAFSMLKERFSELTKSQVKITIWSSFKDLKANKIVMSIIALIFIKLFELSLVGSLGFYVNSYFVFGGDVGKGAVQTGWIATVAVFVTILSSLLVKHFSHVTSKEKLIAYCLVIDVFGHLSKIYTFTPENPNLMFISISVLTFSSSIFWIVIVSMLADACDVDELDSGKRREGMITAFSNWCSKSAMAIGLILSGFILQSTGFDVSTHATPSEQSLFEMRILFIVLPIMAYFVGLYIIWHYKLDRARFRSISTRLEMIRGTV